MVGFSAAVLILLGMILYLACKLSDSKARHYDHRPYINRQIEEMTLQIEGLRKKLEDALPLEDRSTEEGNHHKNRKVVNEWDHNPAPHLDHDG